MQDHNNREHRRSNYTSDEILDDMQETIEHITRMITRPERRTDYLDEGEPVTIEYKGR